jgi:LSD1 subclass zinc finger protein
MNFCLNCRMFGNPIVRHLGACTEPILVHFDPKQLGWYCGSCGRLNVFHAGSPAVRCEGCNHDVLIPIYEYPEELRGL